jgi:hypothetical protein
MRGESEGGIRDRVLEKNSGLSRKYDILSLYLVLHSNHMTTDITLTDLHTLLIKMDKRLDHIENDVGILKEDVIGLKTHAIKTDTALADLKTHAISTDAALLDLKTHAIKTDESLAGLKKHAIKTDTTLYDLGEIMAKTNIEMNGNFDNLYSYMGDAFGKISDLQMQQAAKEWRNTMKR